MRQDIIDKSVAEYKKRIAQDPNFEPEDGFIWVMEETDFGKNLSDEKYQEYLGTINRACFGDTAMFEQLPDAVLQGRYGDFSRCEGSWNPMTYDFTERFLRAAQSTAAMLGGQPPFESISAAMAAMKKEGRVIHLPLGYMRAKNEYPKCPRCGQAILEGQAALSRYDNRTQICSDCGTREALEDFTGVITD